ncbi:uncharacterized protein A4U43_C07F34130 [Asparagus officinalis]|uniref:Cullin N-terminal domain-containing protein n=1 Tax=Asparagus officinalis TaxID=4686 RepID=A0A5P1EHD8_ASPOF|nr:uncharacterized protein A4U43_C07F34130 [Asparagus officinalis]
MTHSKRSFSSINSICPLSSPSSSSSMKKAKSHQLTEKNGLHSYYDVTSGGGGGGGGNAGGASEDEDSVLVDQAGVSGSLMTGMASNLLRKKAIPPQPMVKKALKIKLKDKPKLPPSFEEDTWATLKSAITAIFLKKPDPCDSEKLYQAVNDLCIHKMGGNLYQRIQTECEVHISAALMSLVGQSPDLVVFLSLVVKCWQDFSDQMLIIRSIALYLDRTYVKQTNGVDSLWEMGLKLFEKHLSNNKEVLHKIVTGLLRLIERERYAEVAHLALFELLYINRNVLAV